MMKIKGRTRMSNASRRVRTFSDRFSSIGDQHLMVGLFRILHDVYESTCGYILYGGFKHENKFFYIKLSSFLC
jgi:hypothetical protein